MKIKFLSLYVICFDIVDQRQIEKLLKLILLANRSLPGIDIYNRMKREIDE
jgi:hypothetical protein